MLRQCNTTVPAINILVTLLEDQELLSGIVKYGFIGTESEEKLKRRLRCPQQEWPLLEFRVLYMVQKIKSNNISDIRDETVK